MNRINERKISSLVMAQIIAFLLVLALPFTALRAYSQDTTPDAKGQELGSQLEEQIASGAKHIALRMIADQKAIVPGKDFRLGIELSIQPGWHTYYKEPGDAGMPTRIEWQLPEGFQAGPLKWVKPNRFTEGDIITYGYADKTVIATDVSVPKTIKPGEILTLKANVKWLTCKEICVPGNGTTELKMPVVRADAGPSADNAQFQNVNFDGSIKEIGNEHKKVSVLDDSLNISNSSERSFGLLTYLLLAFGGGIILNFMPCVLPVMAIKIINWMEQCDHSRKDVRISGILYTSGVLSSFMLLAALVVSLQAAGKNIGWGFQFQYPPFLIVMAAIVLFFALSLFGVFHIHVHVNKSVCNLADKEGLAGTFFKGVLATILSTPCSAPFLGTALGFAFVQPWYVVTLIFFAIGLGLASPYILLAINPDWLKVLPRPGDWMEKLKEAMGFILLATVAWLVSVYAEQVGVEAGTTLTYFLLIVAFAAWLVSRFTDLTHSHKRVFLIQSAGVLLTALSGYLLIFSRPELLTPPTQAKAMVTPKNKDDIAWRPFDVADLDKQINSGQTVFLDFTAAWCLTCKVNESAVLNSSDIKKEFQSMHVVPIRADWTLQDPVITKLLHKFNRSGVPLYVIFPGHEPDKPIVLPEVITPALVLEKLKLAGPSS
jgi:thiol:disulfide interchange protein